ncbi:hypothetical protein ACFTSF_33130 [Kribbella sp. NPDC056951]|uniref:hypothetical protein n=1 Tax=Kribbella sp. NPDC056951 TaxID=3345978 RepID=UPI003626DA10
MKFRAGAVAAACLFTVLTTSPAMAADPPVAEGTLLGPRLEADPPLQILAATGKYYLTDYGFPTDRTPAPWTIRSTADGSAQGEYRRLNIQIERSPEIVGDYALEWDATRVAPRKLGTEEVQLIDAPTGTEIRNVYPGGALLARGSDFALRTYAGEETPVTGVQSDAQVLDRTDAALLLGTATGLFVLDVATGTASQVATVTEQPTWAQLMPGRVIWQTASTDSSTTLAWKNRSGSGDGTVVVPFKQPLVPLGDDVAVRVADTKELAKVDVETGTVTRNLVTGVHDVEDQGNGRVLVTAQSQVASVGADGVLRTVTETPPFRGQSDDVMLAGDRVVTAMARPPQDGVDDASDRPLDQTTDLGSTWTRLPVKSDTHYFGRLSADAMLTYRRTADSTIKAVVVDSQGEFEIGNWEGRLGRGGKLAAAASPGSSAVNVYDVQTRQRIGTFDDSVGLSGTTIWRGPDANGNLEAISGGFAHQVPAGTGCGTTRRIEAAGRWVVVDCSGPDRIVDAQGVIPVRTLTLEQNWKLGFNFLVQRAPSATELKVTDLNTLTLPERRYGPVAGFFWPRTAFAPDDADTQRFIYKDINLQPRIATLDWVPAQPNFDADQTAPALTTGDAGPRVRTDQGVTFRWAFADAAPASGVAQFDVRYQERPTPTAPYGDWVVAWPNLNRQMSAVLHSGPRGSDTCFQVRARDHAGNESAWSQSFCSEYDGTAPKLASASAGGPVLLAASGKFEYGFTDSSGAVSSYDVALRDAPVGRAAGPWQYPAGWQGMTSTSVTWTPVPGVERCYMVRARDAAGNESAWSVPNCAMAPQDDRALTAAGTFTRTANSTAYKGTVTTLKSTGASLTKAGEAGVRVALVTFNGPGQGSVDVYHAGVKVGRVSLAATTAKQTITTLPVTPYRAGEIKLVAVSASPVVIDGVAVLRG